MKAFFWASMFSVSLASATDQVSDILILGKDSIPLFTFPLELHPKPMDAKSKGKNHAWEFFGDKIKSTSCWRGYRGVWTIQGDSLLLKGVIDCHQDSFEVFVPNINGNDKGVTYADWFSGDLRLPGEKLDPRYATTPWGKKKDDVLIRIAKGKVVRTLENRTEGGKVGKIFRKENGQ